MRKRANFMQDKQFINNQYIRNQMDDDVMMLLLRSNLLDTLEHLFKKEEVGEPELVPIVQWHIQRFKVTQFHQPPGAMQVESRAHRT